MRERTAKKAKPQVLKPIRPSDSIFHPDNVKIVLFLGGLLLLLLLPFVGIVVLVALLINHFRKT